MNTITLCGETIKVNQREERLVNIINQSAQRVLDYYHENKFGLAIYDRLLDETRNYLDALFFMGVLKKPHSAYELELIRADEEFLEYMLGSNWQTIYE